ncbi:MAG TPA: hypothetical protein VFQ53_39880 [Kofleriaceae bacterium]|nr:hypothetical protein [Kofleriaceae bacterium]
MVASSPSSAPGFTPAERPRVAVAGEGTLAAIAEPTKVTILALPDARAVGEIGLPATREPGDVDVTWLGTRLLVLSRLGSHSTAHLVEPIGEAGPSTIAEIRLETAVRLFAAVGPHALVLGPQGAAVLTAGDATLTPYQFPARSLPIAAGAAGAQFIVALPNAVEEWSPASRMPKRRLRLPRPAAITALGGSDRVVWLTTQQDPTRIDVLPIVNRGQPKAHELPEPIGHIASHPKSDLLLVTGADTGKLYVVDLDGRTRLRTLAIPNVDRVEAAGLVLGRTTAALAAQARRPIAVVTLVAASEPPAKPAAPVVASPVVVPTAGEPAMKSSLVEEPTVVDEAPPPRVHELAAVTAPVTPVRAPDPAPAPGKPAGALSAKFSEWRDRVGVRPPRKDEVVAGTPSWRDDLVAWARAVAAGAVDRTAPLPPSPPPAPALDELAARFDLPASLVPALAILYGMHLAGERGAAPVDLARVLGRRWDEALGRGQLAARGIATYTASRVIATPAILRVLDERPPATGTLVGEPGPSSLLGPCAFVDDTSSPLAPLAERCLASIGCAILAAHADADLDELLLEARARGAVAMQRFAGHDRPELAVPMIVVVPDHAAAWGMPVVGR